MDRHGIIVGQLTYYLPKHRHWEGPSWVHSPCPAFLNWYNPGKKHHIRAAVESRRQRELAEGHPEGLEQRTEELFH